MTNTIRLLLLLPSLSSSLTRSASSSFQNAWKLKKERRRGSAVSQFLLLYHSAEHSSVLVLLEKEELVTPPFHFVLYQQEERKLDQRHHPTSSRESLHVPTYHNTKETNTSGWIELLFGHVTRERKEEDMNRSLVHQSFVKNSRSCYTYWIVWCC